jgi:serine/threonine-protein kinase
MLLVVDSAAAGAQRFALADSLLAQAEVLDAAWTRPIVARAELAIDELLAARQRAHALEVVARGIGHADRALTMEPRNAAALEYRGTLRLYKQVMGLTSDPAESADLVGLAEVDLEAATSIDKQRSGAFAALSLLRYNRYDIVGASLAARQAYEADAYLRSARQILYRLYATNWDLRQFERADEYCKEGGRRFPEQSPFLRCQLWLLSTGVRQADPHLAWKLVDDLARTAPANRREYARRQAQMIAALTIDRAGYPDSARRVIERARADTDIDPGRELVGDEVIVRSMLGDTDEALRLLQLYLTANPTHRDGFTRANRWELQVLRQDPRFLAIVGSGD